MFQVSRDAGVPLVLPAAILILVGLLPALYSSRRKVWVRAEPSGEGAVLQVGGFALQRKPQFEEEFGPARGDRRRGGRRAVERSPRSAEADETSRQRREGADP